MNIDNGLVIDLAIGVASRHCMSVANILGKGRFHEHVRARDDLITCLFGSGWSYSRIGRALDMDHTSVRLAVMRDLR